MVKADNETAASRHVSRFISQVFPNRDSDDANKRKYLTALGNLKAFIIERNIAEIDNTAINEYIKNLEQRYSKKTVRDYTTPIRNFIVWGQTNAIFGRDIIYDIGGGKADYLISLFDKDRWYQLDSIMKSWAKGVSYDGISPENLYNRKVLVNYIRFMIEAQPLSSEIADVLVWKNIMIGHANMATGVLYKGERVVDEDKNGALIILGRWSIATRFRARNDLVFRYVDDTKVDYLVEIQKMVMDLKRDVNAIVSKMDLRRQEYYDLKVPYDMAHELFEAARKIIIRQGTV